MATILIRDIEPELLAALKTRAKKHGRSLQAELKDVLEQAGRSSVVDSAALLERVRRTFAGRSFPDSAELIAEDRRR